jgi:hypothetical protein
MRKAKSQDGIRKRGVLLNVQALLEDLLTKAAERGDNHSAVELAGEIRQWRSFDMKARKERVDPNKFPPAFDNLNRWLVNVDLAPHPEALEAFYKRMEIFENNQLEDYQEHQAVALMNGKDTAADPD